MSWVPQFSEWVDSSGFPDYHFPVHATLLKDRTTRVLGTLKIYFRVPTRSKAAWSRVRPDK